MSLVIIYYSLKPVKISYANGRVSVRIFYKNNLTRFRFEHFVYFVYFFNINFYEHIIWKPMHTQVYVYYPQLLPHSLA
jgi:hypothetical protein